ncbi:hypothetical protein [Leeuwenhoekiella sp. NPDC079379]|uniref:hypothetical protein n=1 Tax=Leeuwenhoekiella sp. NPDC079379 TaxID=3364122 RepID=UPI0037C9D7C2
MKNIFLLLVLILFFSNCTKQPEADTNLLHLIPHKSAAILRVPNWNTFKNNLKSNELANKIKPTGFAKTLENYASLFSKFNPENESYISFVALGDNDYDIALFTEVSKNVALKDSTFTKSLKKTDYEGTTINTYIVNEIEVYYIISNEILIASTSKLVLENTILQGNTGRDPIDSSLQKMIKTSDASHANLYIKGSYYKRLFKDILSQYKFALKEVPFEWAAIDLEIDNKKTQFTGVLTSAIENGHTLSLLNELESGSSKVASVTPASSIGFSSLSVNNWEQYKINLAEKRAILLKDFKLPLEDFFQSVNEVGLIYTSNENLIFANSVDNQSSEKALAAYSSKRSEYREIPIYELTDSLAFNRPFSELLNPPAVHTYCKLDSYYVFSKTTSALEDLIANYQNGAVVTNSDSYKQFQKKLSDESTLFYYGNVSPQKTFLEKKVDKSEGKILTKINLEDYPNAGIQFIQADNFTYVNAVISKYNVHNKKTQVSQIASIKLDNDVLDSPQLLDNYRTKGKNILVQDISNNLYHIDSSGKIEWKKEIDGPILGKIQQVDLYKNGRLQYAFTTANRFYILASDGEIVKPFGQKFENIITQPLAVFDYDGSRNYRFVITQGATLQMLDNTASIVKGFDYDKTSNLLNAPQHLRSGTKDYILTQLEDGSLNILDRRGNNRITINQKFKFSGYPISIKNGNFILFEADGTQIAISESGKITTKKNKLSSGFLYDNLGSVEAALFENKLVINGHEKELELGIYKGLKVIRFEKKYYVVLTDLQTNKIYLFNTEGILLPNFPVYGSSNANAGSLNSTAKMGLVTKGESNSVIIYQIN